MKRPRLSIPGVERGPSVKLEINGREVRAHVGETLATLLLVEGVAARRTCGGSPRSLYCGMGVCFDCLVVVDGLPNTRACMTPVSAGMTVETQEGWHG